MKSRHGAAPLLGGWYLMLPPSPAPTNGKIKQLFDKSAPLSKWWAVPRSENGSAYHDWAECQAELEKLCATVNEGVPQSKRSKMCDDALCIEDVDPRLKGNLRYRGN